MTFHERLTAAVVRHGPLCVGLDPRFDSLPNALKARGRAAAYEAFCLRVLDLVRPRCKRCCTRPAPSAS
jgi:orotidine-5'-phosphate decarboxylase